MRTVVVSDLHLGSRFDGDLVRRERFRDVLLRQLEGADRAVLLGDLIELRDRRLGDAFEIARPFFEALGEAAGAAQIVLVPGNHDHQLLAPWLERRRLDGDSGLGLEQVSSPISGLAALLAERIGRGELVLAYPGLWLSPGVYATHGHYLDCHITIPTFERLGIAMVERATGKLPAGLRAPSDYESVQEPLYTFLYGVAQSARRGRRAVGENASARVWEAVHGRNGEPPGLRARLVGSVLLPSAVAVANRIGLGPLRWDISLEAIQRAGVRAMAELVARLEIDAEHVIFGHTHRRGPLGDDPDFHPVGGPELVNVGSWVYAPALTGATGAGDPFWPGTIAIVEDDGAPRLHHLLDDVSAADLRRTRAAANS
jgi:Calcineurin-like phosphoesterase